MVVDKKPFNSIKKKLLKNTYSGMQLCAVQVFCDLGLTLLEQEWTEAGVSSSDLTQLTSRLIVPRNVNEIVRQLYALAEGVGYPLCERAADVRRKSNPQRVPIWAWRETTSIPDVFIRCFPFLR